MLHANCSWDEPYLPSSIYLLGPYILVSYTLTYVYTYNLSMTTQRTPLHVAAGKGYKYTTEVIVKAGADINVKDNDGVCTILLIYS